MVARLYQIGDRVKITNPDKDYECARFPLGTIGVITEIEEKHKCVIGISVDGDDLPYFYFPREISRYPSNNADYIRNMTDEQLAHFLICFNNTFGEEYEGEISCLNWLQNSVDIL